MKKDKILYIGNKLAQKGYTPTSVDTLAPKLKELNIEVLSVSSYTNKVVRMAHMLLSIVRYRKNLSKIIIDTYSTTNFWYAYFCGRLARLLTIPYVCLLHGGNLPFRIKKSPKACASLFSKAYVNVTPSLYLFKVFQQEGFSKLVHIPNFITIENYSFKERKIIRPKLLWVRSLVNIYNPLLALKIMEELQKEFPLASLTIVGPEKDKALAEECRAYVVNHNLNVIFTGNLSRQEWVSLSGESDIFINTTNFDNTPVSVIEAMALGIPIVSTNVGGMPFLVEHDKEGLLCNPRDKEVFLASIHFLIANPEKAYQMSLCARKKAETFDWNKGVKQQWKNLLLN